MADPLDLDAAAPTSETAARILEAALVSAEKYGVRRMTMEDIAREAGLARVTLYTHFRTKDDIVRGAALNELGRVLGELDTVFAQPGTAEERLVRTFAHAIRLLRGHALLQRLLAVEPEVLMPFLTGDSAVLAIAGAWAAQKIREAEGPPPPIPPEHGGELLMRIVQSVLLAPTSTYALDEPGELERMAREWLVPVVLAHG